MSNDISKPKTADRHIGRRKLLQLAAGVIAGTAISGLPLARRAIAQPTNQNKILIAYYSRTGTTREVANQIRARVGGELFELKTAHSYPAAYRATTDQAKREQKEGFRPVLVGEVADMEHYGTVFIGLLCQFWSRRLRQAGHICLRPGY